MSESRLPIHPYAALFPAMSSPEFDRLCGDISRNGLHEEIVVHEGQVLEGRHRYLACLAKQVPPRFRLYAGECGSPLAFVVTKNSTAATSRRASVPRWRRASSRFLKSRPGNGNALP